MRIVDLQILGNGCRELFFTRDIEKACKLPLDAQRSRDSGVGINYIKFSWQRNRAWFGVMQLQCSL